MSDEKASESALSPIQKLPTELLIKIFGYYCLDINRVDFLYKNGKYVVGVTIVGLKLGSVCTQLGSVCTQWMKVFLSLPSLVSRLLVHFDELDRVPSREEISYIAQSLELSFPSHDVILELWPPMKLTEEEHHSFSEQLSKYLRQFFSRIRNLTLCSVFTFLVQPTGTFVSLHSLELHTDIDSIIELPIDLTTSAPNLQSLSVDQDLPSLTVNWIKIRHLTIRESGADYALAMISRCTMLESLILDECYHLEGSSSASSEILHAPTLRHLEVVSVDRGFETEAELDFIRQIALFLVMPSLSHCHFHYRSTYEDEDYSSGFYNISDLIRHSQASMKSLEWTFLDQITVTALNDLAAVIANCPRVEVVDYQDTYGTIDLSEALKLLHWPSLPLLRTVRLPISAARLNPSAVVSMVKSRWEAEEGRKIHSLFLDSTGAHSHWQHRELNETIRSSLKAMQNEGLKILIDD